LTQYALPGIIVLTSVGAFLMCLLVIRYGFGSREIDVDDDEARRLAMTRIGHAVAAVCFAGTALLAVVALPARTQPRPQPVASAPGAAVRRSDEASALPTGATVEHFRATVKGVNVDVQARPLRNNETAYLVRLMDETNRPVTGADVMLVGKRGDGTSVVATLEPTNEPGVHRGRVPTPGS